MELRTIEKQFDYEVYKQVRDQVLYKLANQILNQVSDQVWRKVNNQVITPTCSQINEKIKDEVWYQLWIDINGT